MAMTDNSLDNLTNINVNNYADNHSDNCSDSLPTHQEIWQNTLSWQPTSEQQAKFQRIYQLLKIANQKVNLTRIVSPDDFWEKHLWDSLAGICFLGQNFPDFLLAGKVIDIGTGAGFPGLPVAIYLGANCQTVLLDSTQKKLNFINTVLEDLQINYVTTLAGRVEAIARTLQQRESYQLCLIRAVANVAVCAEYVLPLLKINGMAILYRGNWTAEEADDLDKVSKILGGKIVHVHSFHTPLSESQRHCIYLQKVAPTASKYPRSVGIPSHQPLNLSEN